MKQLGNLAVVVASHKDCSLQIYNETAVVHTGQGSDRKCLICNVWDDKQIRKIVAHLNYGEELIKDEAV